MAAPPSQTSMSSRRKSASKPKASSSSKTKAKVGEKRSRDNIEYSSNDDITISPVRKSRASKKNRKPVTKASKAKGKEKQPAPVIEEVSNASPEDSSEEDVDNGGRMDEPSDHDTDNNNKQSDEASDGLQDRHRASIPQRITQRKEKTKDLLLIFSDITTVNFNFKNGSRNTLKGRWCYECKLSIIYIT